LSQISHQGSVAGDGKSASDIGRLTAGLAAIPGPAKLSRSQLRRLLCVRGLKDLGLGKSTLGTTTSLAVPEGIESEVLKDTSRILKLTCCILSLATAAKVTGPDAMSCVR
jgi:hypothetical protein